MNQPHSCGAGRKGFVYSFSPVGPARGFSGPVLFSLPQAIMPGVPKGVFKGCLFSCYSNGIAVFSFGFREFDAFVAIQNLYLSSILGTQIVFSIPNVELGGAVWKRVLTELMPVQASRGKTPSAGKTFCNGRPIWLQLI